MVDEEKSWQQDSDSIFAPRSPLFLRLLHVLLSLEKKIPWLISPDKLLVVGRPLWCGILSALWGFDVVASEYEYNSAGYSELWYTFHTIKSHCVYRLLSHSVVWYPILSRLKSFAFHLKPDADNVAYRHYISENLHNYLFCYANCLVCNVISHRPRLGSLIVASAAASWIL